MSSDSRKWGPFVWYMMHKIAFCLPQNTIETNPKTKHFLIRFYTVLRVLLPCSSCRMHYGWSLSKMPPSKHFRSGIKSSKWVVTIHNLTNNGLRKKEVSYNSAKNMYLSKSGIYSKIDHKKLASFIDYILIWSNDKPLANRKTIANCTCHLYPCLKCRKRLMDYLKKNSLDRVKNSKQMENWARKMKNIVLQKC